MLVNFNHGAIQDIRMLFKILKFDILSWCTKIYELKIFTNKKAQKQKYDIKKGFRHLT